MGLIFCSSLKNIPVLQGYPAVKLPKYTYTLMQLPPPPQLIVVWFSAFFSEYLLVRQINK